MKMIRKSVSIILAVLMVVSCMYAAGITVSAEETITSGFYVIGSKEVCGSEWEWREPWLYGEPMKLSSNGKTYYQVFENVQSSYGHNTDSGSQDVFEFKVVYIDENGNAAWHPGGMGNNTEVKVEKCGSTILFQFKLLSSKPTRDGIDPEAVIAEVYSPDDEKPSDYSAVPYLGTPDTKAYLDYTYAYENTDGVWGSWYAYTWDDDKKHTAWVNGKIDGTIIEFEGLYQNVMFTNYSGPVNNSFDNCTAQTNELITQDGGTFKITGMNIPDAQSGERIMFSGEWVTPVETTTAATETPTETATELQQETTESVEATSAPVTGDGIHRPIVSNVVNSKEKVETNSYMFYVPNEWKNEYNNYYDYNPDTKGFTGSGYFAAGIYWWDGPYNSYNNRGGFATASPGYAVVETVDGNPNIFRADVPKSVLGLQWNNLVDYGEDKNNPLYSLAKRTTTINCDFYDNSDYTYGFYPDGVESFDGMIYVCNPYYSPSTISEYSEKFYGGAWFYYYGNGEYGIYKTREEAEANNGIYKNGKFPKYEGMPEETTTPETEPATTVAPEITSAPEVTTTPTEIETTTASQTTEPVETTEATEHATVVTEPQDTTAPEVTTTAPETTTVTEPAETKAPVKKTKKTNPIKVTVKTKTVKLKKLKNNNQKVKAITVKKAKGKASYSLVKKGSNSKLFKLAKISNKGIITLKKWKKAKKGKYNLIVKITAKGNSKFKPKTINKLVKIKIK
ncbi:MAG: hypothetical protein VZQ55_03665 [Ruminococcus sp.]|nr:hypothetical protein [Ruminococcus sp.]